MKRLLSLMLVFVLTLGLALSLAACPMPAPAPGGSTTSCEGGGEGGGERPDPSEPPAGYQWFDNGAITFAYPENWSKQEGSTTMLINPMGAGNNITVVYEPFSNIYTTMDLAGFNSTLKPVLEAMGATITNATVEQTENARGVAITKISYSMLLSGNAMRQTLLVIPRGEYNYSIAITETTGDSALVSTVFDTLAAKEA